MLFLHRPGVSVSTNLFSAAAVGDPFSWICRALARSPCSACRTRRRAPRWTPVLFPYRRRAAEKLDSCFRGVRILGTWGAATTTSSTQLRSREWGTSTARGFGRCPPPLPELVHVRGSLCRCSRARSSAHYVLKIPQCSAPQHHLMLNRSEVWAWLRTILSQSDKEIYHLRTDRVLLRPRGGRKMKHDEIKWALCSNSLVTLIWACSGRRRLRQSWTRTSSCLRRRSACSTVHVRSSPWSRCTEHRRPKNLAVNIVCVRYLKIWHFFTKFTKWHVSES